MKKILIILLFSLGAHANYKWAKKALDSAMLIELGSEVQSVRASYLGNYNSEDKWGKYRSKIYIFEVKISKGKRVKTSIWKVELQKNEDPKDELIRLPLVKSLNFR